ncbi:MAG: outer membrane beta-barrel protein [Candidatus Eisenbacteria bacterium]|nr:outer membrane beta-barrel protein [Candidatus Eisenbacteria bacterium]
MLSNRTPRIVPILLAALLATSVTVAASSLNGGTVELRARGSFVHHTFDGGNDVEQTANVASLNCDLGYFLTSMVEVAGGVIYEHSSVEWTGPNQETKDTDSRIGLMGQLILNFPSSGAIVPFVGGGAGFLSLDSKFENTTTGYEDEGDYEKIYILPRVEGGIRVLVGDSASINIAGFYEHRKNDEGIEDADADNMGVSLGITIFPVRR